MGERLWEKMQKVRNAIPRKYLGNTFFQCKNDVGKSVMQKGGTHVIEKKNMQLNNSVFFKANIDFIRKYAVFYIIENQFALIQLPSFLTTLRNFSGIVWMASLR